MFVNTAEYTDAVNGNHIYDIEPYRRVNIKNG